MRIIDFIFPKVCLECKRQGSYMCVECLSKLPLLTQVCPVCERPSVDGFTHPKCIKPQGINGVVSLWSYKGIVRKALVALKYKFVKEVSNEIKEHSLSKLKDFTLFKNNDGILTTVPLFWMRKNLRGYNQVDELAEAISNYFNFKYCPDLLIRKRLTSPQVGLSREKRLQNIKGAFVFNRKYKLVADNAFVVVVDDVYTTGSTLKEAAKVLKRKGVSKVWGLTIAR